MKNIVKYININTNEPYNKFAYQSTSLTIGIYKKYFTVIVIFKKSRLRMVQTN